MMDPAVLCISGGALIGVLVVLTYFFFSWEEGDFDRAYDTKKLALLTESERKEKEKKNKNKNKNQKKQQTQQQKEQQKDQQQKEEAESTEDEKTADQTHPDEISEQVDGKEVASVTASPPQPTKTVSTPVNAVEEPKEQSPKQSTKQESPKENGKKKQVKVVNAKDLDQKKVIARLSAIADLEEGYVQYLTTTFRDGDLLKNNLSSEVKALTKKLTESNQKVEKLQKEKTVSADKEKQEQNKQAALSSKVQSLQTRETELSQSVHAAQTTLQQREEAHKKEIQTLRNKVSHLENENHSQKASNGKLTAQLATVQTQLANASATEIKESAEEIAKLKDKVAEFEKSVKELQVHHDAKMSDYYEISQDAAKMEKSITELEESLASSRRDLVAQTERAVKKEQAVQKLEAEKAELMKKMNDSQNLDKLVQELTGDVSEFHDKKQQEDLVTDLETRSEKLREEWEAERTQLKNKEQALHKELEMERSKLAVAEKALADEQSRVVEIPRNSTAPEVVEEVFELKKTNTDLAAAPSTSAPSADLVAKVAQLEEKNQELRGRNYTLLEKTEDLPKTIINERKRVVEQVCKLAKKPFKNVDDETAFFEWLGQSVSGVQKDLTAPKVAPATSTPVPARTEAPIAQCSASSSHYEGYYRTVVAQLLSQIEHVDALVQKAQKA